MTYDRLILKIRLKLNKKNLTMIRTTHIRSKTNINQSMFKTQFQSKVKTLNQTRGVPPVASVFNIYV